MDGFTTRLFTGIAEQLHAAGVGLWRPEVTYAEDEVGIVLGLPTASPAAVIALLTYSTTDDPVHADSVISMQLRVRAPNGLAGDLADAAFDELHGLWSVVLGGIWVQSITRTSALPLGTDSSGRDERADNYDLAVHRPGPHRD